MRAAEQRPPFAQVRRVGLDDERLHRDARPLRDDAHARRQAIHGCVSGARALRKQEQHAALTQVGDRFLDHLPRHVAADITGQARAWAQKQIAHQRALHDAREVRMAREDQQRIDQRGMVGGENEGRPASQRVDCPQIEPVGAREAEQPGVQAKAGHDPEASGGAPGAAWQCVQRQGDHRPEQADDAEQNQQANHRNGVVNGLQRAHVRTRPSRSPRRGARTA